MAAVWWSVLSSSPMALQASSSPSLSLSQLKSDRIGADTLVTDSVYFSRISFPWPVTNTLINMCWLTWCIIAKMKITFFFFTSKGNVHPLNHADSSDWDFFKSFSQVIWKTFHLLHLFLLTQFSFARNVLTSNRRAHFVTELCSLFLFLIFFLPPSDFEASPQRFSGMLWAFYWCLISPVNRAS